MAEKKKLKVKSPQIWEKIEPQERLKQLIDYSNQVDIDPNVPPIRYYRSGLEMVRMANVYYQEGGLENAYVLYLKFMTLFVEKIRNHPEYTKVPVEVKARNQAQLREVFPKAEKLKQQLLEQYAEDYKNFLAELRQQENAKDKKHSLKTEENDKNPKQQESLRIDQLPKPIANFPKPVSNLDQINYPDAEVPSAPPPSTSEVISNQLPTPAIDRSKKPTDQAYDSQVLRTVIVPVKVMTLFQAMAQTNTFKNIETVGVLTGKLEKNTLIITHMILPKQKGTSDSCITMNEEELFDYQDQHNLITLGWIHTHPTQTAFLSSVDLHTHCPYQLLMPEAIAIVCSPKYNETGFFNLTPNHGLQYIANCRHNGFHPHQTDPPLFTTAEHVVLDTNAPLDVLDLRFKN